LIKSVSLNFIKAKLLRP